MEGIRNYKNEQFQHIGSNVSQESLSKLRSSFEQFRNEAGARLGSSRSVRGVIVGGAENVAQTVDNKLTESGERNDKKAQVLGNMYSNMQEIMQKLGVSREAEMENQ